MKKYVQHISRTGYKWELLDHLDNDREVSCWRVFPQVDRNMGPVLPRSEYVRCDPPEIWEKVEVGIRGSQSGILYLKEAPHLLNFAKLSEGFRWAYSGDNLIIERKKS